jgi:hypothetical protein
MIKERKNKLSKGKQASPTPKRVPKSSPADTSEPEDSGPMTPKRRAAFAALKPQVGFDDDHISSL